MARMSLRIVDLKSRFSNAARKKMPESKFDSGIVKILPRWCRSGDSPVPFW
jgi:hypothetical protein